MDLFTDVMQYQQFFIFLILSKNTYVDQFILLNLAKMWSFMRIRCKVV